MEVILYCEQTATFNVSDDLRSLSDKELTQHCLGLLDESGGAEWITTAGWIER